MRPTEGDRRFWESTRGRIILLLRGGGRSVSELAAALGLTESAVRTQLDRLARDGLVRSGSTRPGPRKPTIVYELTLEADRLFPKVYGPLLRHVLDELMERLPAKKQEEMARAVGHRLAAEHRSTVQAQSLPDRIAQAVSLLGEWGGVCQSEGQDGRTVLRCSNCPLALIAVGHPEVCLLMETVLADLLSVPVQQRCRAEPAPQCHFEIRADGTS
jgi:predicted ArsR family transcriptional regulator